MDDEDSDPEYSRLDDIMASIPLDDDSDLVQPATATTPLPTRLLDDIFHVQNRLLRTLSKTHSGFKPFARAFSEALLIPDKSDEDAVKTFYAQRNIPWSVALKSKAHAI